MITQTSIYHSPIYPEPNRTAEIECTLANDHRSDQEPVIFFILPGR